MNYETMDDPDLAVARSAANSRVLSALKASDAAHDALKAVTDAYAVLSDVYAPSHDLARAMKAIHTRLWNLTYKGVDGALTAEKAKRDQVKA